MIRTDLAKEAFDRTPDVAGVTQQTRQLGCVTVTRICVETEEAAEKLQKPVGTYVSVEMEEEPATCADALSDAVAEELAQLLGGFGHLLCIGLGNRFVTPDSLGPRTVEKLFVTRHIKGFAPELAPENMRTVSAIAPGVLGVTGLETLEVVRGLCETVRPDALLCIDALASERADRIACSVQINDSGLLPGAGVGNRQRGIDPKTLGLPVFAVGVPTVIRASAIAAESIALIERQMGVSETDGSLTALAEKLTAEHMGELIVTPANVDKLIEDASRRLAKGVNLALHRPYYREIETLILA